MQLDQATAHGPCEQANLTTSDWSGRPESCYVRRPGARVAYRLLLVRPEAFEQAPEERFVSRQACCPVGVGFGPEL